MRMTEADPTDTWGLFEGFEGYRTPTDEDYRSALTHGLIVPDANVLLNLYRYNDQTREDLFTVLDRLGDHLWVPHQVLVEFWRNRESAIHEPREFGERTVDALSELRQQSINAIRTWANRLALPRNRITELQDPLNRGFTDVIEAITDYINVDVPDERRDTNRDAVVARLASLLKGHVGPPPDGKTYDACRQEAKRRLEAGVPPGYKDKGKELDQAIGDYLVWAQLLGEAAKRHCDALFVTGDVKDDWWRRERGEARGPRLELVNEFRVTAGARLLMLRPESLLVHAKRTLQVQVREASVQDAERVERLSAPPFGGWTQDAVNELLGRLALEGPVQAAAIVHAAKNGGIVSRDQVFQLGGFEEGRMLRGFTRPPNRIAQELRDHRIISDGAVDVLKAVYDPSFGGGVQASAFEVPAVIIPLIEQAAARREELKVEVDLRLTEHAEGFPSMSG